MCGCIQACGRHGLSFSPFVMACVHLVNVFAEDISLSFCNVFSHTNFFMPVFASLCVEVQISVVCIICLLATRKQRTLEFYSACSSFISRVARGWLDGLAAPKYQLGMWALPILILLLFFVVPADACAFNSPSCIYRHRFLFEISIQGLMRLIHKSSDALKKLSCNCQSSSVGATQKGNSQPVICRR